MEHRINELKTDFIKIIELKENTIQVFNVLQTRIKSIKEHYGEFINTNKHHLFVFTLDSFHFQGKLIDIEYEDMQRMYLAITNKMYCEYYKLHKIIVEYIQENITEKKLVELINVNNSFPVYKDLEPFKQYDFEIIKHLHEAILTLLESLNGHLLNKEHDLKVYQTKNKIGFSIDNFVNTFNFNNNMLREKITLFITYIEFFHKMHTKYLSRFTTKIQLMVSQVNHDIKFEPAAEKKPSKNVLEYLKTNANIDTENAKNIRRIMYDETSSLNGSDSSGTSETPTMHNNTPRSRSDSSYGLGSSYGIESEIINIKTVFLEEESLTKETIITNEEPFLEESVTKESVEQVVLEESVEQLVLEESVEQLVLEESVQEFVLGESVQEFVLGETVQEIILEESVEQLVV